MKAIRKASRWTNDDSLKKFQNIEVDESVATGNAAVIPDDSDQESIHTRKSKKQKVKIDEEPSDESDEPDEPAVQALLELGNSKGKKGKKSRSKKKGSKKTKSAGQSLTDGNEESGTANVLIAADLHQNADPHDPQPSEYVGHVEADDVIRFVGDSLSQDNNENAHTSTGNGRKRKQGVNTSTANAFDSNDMSGFEGILSNPTWEKFLNDDIGETTGQAQNDEYNIFIQQQHLQQAQQVQQVQQQIQQAAAEAVAAAQNHQQPSQSQPAKKRRKGHNKTTTATSNVDPALEHLDDSAHSEHYKEQQLVEQAMLQASAIASSLESTSDAAAAAAAATAAQLDLQQLQQRSQDSLHPIQVSQQLQPHSRKRRQQVAPNIVDQDLNDSLAKNWSLDGGHEIAINSRGGSFTKEEVDLLDRFMVHFMESKGMTRDDLCQRVWASQRKKDSFWDLVSSVLPHRTRSSVYKHVRRTYHVFNARGKWDKETDSQLEILVNERGAQWKSIGHTLGRMPEDCRDRWRNYLKCGEQRNQNKWNTEEENRLKEIVTSILDDSETNGEINWTIVSDKMGGTRSRIQCRYKWNKLSKRANATISESMSNADKQTFVSLLKNYADEAQITWDTVAVIEGRGVYTAKDFSSIFERLKSRIPDSDQKEFQDLLDLIIEDLSKEDVPSQGSRKSRKYSKRSESDSKSKEDNDEDKDEDEEEEEPISKPVGSSKLADGDESFTDEWVSSKSQDDH